MPEKIVSFTLRTENKTRTISHIYVRITNLTLCIQSDDPYLNLSPLSSNLFKQTESTKRPYNTTRPHAYTHNIRHASTKPRARAIILAPAHIHMKSSRGFREKFASSPRALPKRNSKRAHARRAGEKMGPMRASAL